MRWRVHAVFVMVQVLGIHAQINVQDFSVDCGTELTGAVGVLYRNALPTGYSRMYVNSEANECSFIMLPNQQMIWSKSTTTCDSGVTTVNGLVTNTFIVTFQQDEFFVSINDQRFLITCSYVPGQITTQAAIVTQVVSPGLPLQDSLLVTVHGSVDMQYTMRVYNQTTGASLTTVAFGSNVVLEITMSNTDANEQGIRVRSCDMISGGLRARFIDDFCPASTIAMNPGGFISSGLKAELFGLESVLLSGSSSNVMTFECTVDICTTACNGANCAGRRKRQTEDDEAQIKLSKLVTIVFHGESDSVTGGCFEDKFFLITVVSLFAVLLLTVILIFVFFYLRRRDRGNKT